MTDITHEMPSEEKQLTEADVRALLESHKRDIEKYIDAKFLGVVTRQELEAAMMQQGVTTDTKLANFTAAIERAVRDMLATASTQTSVQLNTILENVRTVTQMVHDMNAAARANEADIRKRRAELDVRLKEIEESNDTIRYRQDDTEHRFKMVTDHVMGDKERNIPSLSEQIHTTLSAVNALAVQQQQTASQVEMVYKQVLRIRKYASTRLGRAVIAGGFLTFAIIVAIIDRLVLNSVLGG